MHRLSRSWRNGPRWLVPTVIVLAGVALSAPQTSAARPKPNILLILLDDVRADDVAAMPNVQSLIAAEGTTFDRFYASMPLCCPSRASLLTGEYVHNHGVRTNSALKGGGHKAFVELGHEQRTIGRVMKERGYRTALIGKYLNDYGEPYRTVPVGWDTFDPAEPTDLERMAKVRTWIADNSRGKPRPWFGYVGFRAAHAPYSVSAKNAGAYADAVPPAFSSPSFDEADVTDKPAYVQLLPRIGDDVKATITSQYRQRSRMLLDVDDFVGEVVRFLGDRGRLDHTYIVVTSDNGWMHGEHRLPQAKLDVYEEGARLPLVVRGPKVLRGVHVDSLASMVDLFATFADIAGSPKRRDGRSLVPHLIGEPTPWRAQVLLENLGTNRRHPQYTALIDERYKYVEYAAGDRELYDLDADPYETESLHATAPPELLTQLSAKLDALEACSGASCRTADSAP